MINHLVLKLNIYGLPLIMRDWSEVKHFNSRGDKPKNKGHEKFSGIINLFFFRNQAINLWLVKVIGLKELYEQWNSLIQGQICLTKNASELNLHYFASTFPFISTFNSNKLTFIWGLRRNLREKLQQHPQKFKQHYLTNSKSKNCFV